MVKLEKIEGHAEGWTHDDSCMCHVCRIRRRERTIITYPAAVPVTRERKLPNIDRIVIYQDRFDILYWQGRCETFERDDNDDGWRLYIEDIKQTQDEKAGGFKRTLFLMKGTEFDNPTSCRIIEDKKIIFCGEHPEKMGML